MPPSTSRGNYAVKQTPTIRMKYAIKFPVREKLFVSSWQFGSLQRARLSGSIFKWGYKQQKFERFPRQQPPSRAVWAVHQITIWRSVLKYAEFIIAAKSKDWLFICHQNSLQVYIKFHRRRRWTRSGPHVFHPVQMGLFPTSRSVQWCSRDVCRSG